MAKSAATRQLKNQIQSARSDIYQVHILNAAERVFAQTGFEQATIRAIAKTAGVSVGSIYGVFSSKDAIYAAIHERHNQALHSAAVDIAKNAASTPDILDQGARVSIEYYCAHEHYLRIQLREGYAWGLDVNTSSRQSNFWQSGWRLLTNTIAQGQAQGQLGSGEPTELARLIMAAHQVMLASWLSAQPRHSVDEVVKRTQVAVRRIVGLKA